jgi:hypothetical protein
MKTDSPEQEAGLSAAGSNIVQQQLNRFIVAFRENAL